LSTFSESLIWRSWIKRTYFPAAYLARKANTTFLSICTLEGLCCLFKLCTFLPGPYFHSNLKLWNSVCYLILLKFLSLFKKFLKLLLLDCYFDCRYRILFCSILFYLFWCLLCKQFYNHVFCFLSYQYIRFGFLSFRKIFYSFQHFYYLLHRSSFLISK
jgi:hypothetical protein